MEADKYTFGPYKIDNKEVFYSSNLSYAMVNLRPLLPGNLFSVSALLPALALDYTPVVVFNNTLTISHTHICTSL